MYNGQCQCAFTIVKKISLGPVIGLTSSFLAVASETDLSQLSRKCRYTYMYVVSCRDVVGVPAP